MGNGLSYRFSIRFTFNLQIVMGKNSVEEQLSRIEVAITLANFDKLENICKVQKELIGSLENEILFLKQIIK